MLALFLRYLVRTLSHGLHRVASLCCTPNSAERQSSAHSTESGPPYHEYRDPGRA